MQNLAHQLNGGTNLMRLDMASFFAIPIWLVDYNITFLPIRQALITGNFKESILLIRNYLHILGVKTDCNPRPNPMTSCTMSFFLPAKKNNDLIEVEVALLLQSKADVSDWPDLIKGITNLFNSFIIR
jgi:hypothetical protein